MKRLVLVLILAVIPALAFADFQIGAVGMYDGDVSQISSAPVSADSFVFGLETRATLWIFQAGATALYMPSYETLLALTDVGLAVDVLFLRFGAGIGPNFGFDTNGGSGVADAGWNLKLAADINLGNLALGVQGFYFYDSLADIGSAFRGTPVLGVNILLRLF